MIDHCSCHEISGFFFVFCLLCFLMYLHPEYVFIHKILTVKIIREDQKISLDIHILATLLYSIFTSYFQRTEALEKSLKQNSGWQQQIKRGLHTLKKQQYQVLSCSSCSCLWFGRLSYSNLTDWLLLCVVQLCFIDHGLASIEEMEQLKTLHGIHCEL